MAGCGLALSLALSVHEGAPSNSAWAGFFVRYKTEKSGLTIAAKNPPKPIHLGGVPSRVPIREFQLVFGFGEIRHCEHDSIALRGSGADGVHVSIEQVRTMIRGLHPLLADILRVRSGGNILRQPAEAGSSSGDPAGKARFPGKRM